MKTAIKLPSLTSFKNPPKDEKKEEVVIADTGTRINKSFTLEELLVHWTAYADRFKAEGKTSEYIIMANRELKLEEDFTIKLYLDNAVQIDQLSDFKPDLLTFLRKNLSNSLIILETSVMERQPERKMYTDNDKLLYILSKYPAVGDLKKRLGLDMDN